MTGRTCTKCRAPVRAERSAVRLTLRCTNPNCKLTVVKDVISKGYG